MSLTFFLIEVFIEGLDDKNGLEMVLLLKEEEEDIKEIYELRIRDR